MQLKYFAVLLFLASSSLSALTIGDALNENPPKLATLKLAIRSDKNPDHINDEGESYLHVASRRNLAKSITLLMQIPQVSALYLHRNHAKQTAIEVAITGNNPKALNELVKSLRLFDDLRIENNFYGSLLHLAALWNRDGMIVPLIKAGVPVNLEDNRGWSALDVARDSGSKEAEEVLADNEAISTKLTDLDDSKEAKDARPEIVQNEKDDGAEDGVEVDDGCSDSAGSNDSRCFSSECKALLSLCAITGVCGFAAICQAAYQ